MKSKFLSKKTVIPIVLLLLTLFCFNACATIHFKSISPPPPTAKLRVAVLTISGEAGKYQWGVSNESFSANTSRVVGKYLSDTGVYEVVSREEVNFILAEREPDTRAYVWLKDDYALTKQYGKALHADYVMLVIRSRTFSGYSNHSTYNMECINIETGKRYSVSDYQASKGSREQNIEIARKTIFPDMYRKLFSNIKEDLLATAIRKGRLIPEEEIKKMKEDVKVSSIQQPPRPTAEPPEVAEKIPAIDTPRLVVYDFDAVEQLNVVALILTDALREELFRLGNFSLVDRENMMQILQELKLQQSGLIDEKQVVKIGKWLAANESITGRLAILGNSYILQAKRTDIKTMETLGLGSLKCETGREEELLSGISTLARRLSGLKE
jgi:curli biogenesis system outer membrane secretion channel CsgG